MSLDDAIIEDSSPAPDPKGSGQGFPGLLQGGQITKIEREGAANLWLAAYQYPPNSGNFFTFQFESLEQIDATLGDGWWQRPQWQVDIKDEEWLASPDVTLVDSAAAVIGIPGTFTGLMTEIQMQTALDMGITDPGLLGQYLSSPEIQLSLAKGGLADWSPERIQAEIRNTDFYRNDLYPGIDQFFNLGSTSPEADWARYRNNVAASLETLGLENTRANVGSLITSGISDQRFNEFAPVFKREYAAAVNQWAETRLGRTLDFNEIFDIFDGTPAPDLARVIEEGNLQFAADQTSLGVESQMISRLAKQTDLTETQIRANFNNAELGLLALGDVGLERAGLSQRQLVNAAFGLTSGGAEGRLSAAEITQRAGKFAREQGLLDDPKAQLFVGFNEDGTPRRPGALRVRPVSG